MSLWIVDGGMITLPVVARVDDWCEGKYIDVTGADDDGNWNHEPVRYVNENAFKRKWCHVECFDDGVDEGMDGEWYSYGPPTWYLSCGHRAYGIECPDRCPDCGARVMEEGIEE